MEEIVFFPQLQRREKYSVTTKGTYYADYRRYKQEVREDCQGRCVYCDSHENEIGGPGHMQLDHFRPKKYEEFQHLVSDPNNLVWACFNCNHLKSDHWPALGTDRTYVGEQGFIDPFEEFCCDYFQVRDDGKLEARQPPAAYLITLLHLNRIHVVKQRRARLQAAEILPELERRIEDIDKQLENDDCQDCELLVRQKQFYLQQKELHKRYLDFNLYD